MSYTKQKKKVNWFGYILRRNCRLKHVTHVNKEGKYKWKEDEEEDVSSYWTEGVLAYKGDT